MRRNICLSRWAVGFVAIALVFGIGIACNSAAQDSKHKLTEAQALELQKSFEDASIAADTAKVSSLMADDAMFVHGSGVLQNKTEYLASLSSGQLKVSVYQMTESKVEFFDGGAVVSGPTEITIVPPGGAAPRTLHMRVSTVWVAKPSGWQLVLNQGTPLSGPPTAAAH